MAYVKVAERKRREELNKRPFVSEYFRLSHRPKCKPSWSGRLFPWKLVFKSTGKVHTGHCVKYAAQEHATELDKLINEAIGRFHRCQKIASREA